MSLKLRSLRRSYKKIDRLESSLPPHSSQAQAAAELRYQFASTTIARAVDGFRASNVPRREIKAWLRRLYKQDID